MADGESYETAMREAASAAWDQDWARAIQAYEQALTIAPDDAQALAGLGLALLESGRYPDALVRYRRVSELVPGDPLPYEKMGEIYQRLGENAQAAKQYLAAGEIYLARKDIRRAVPSWERAIALDPDLAQAHMRLAIAYQQDPRTQQQAVIEYIDVARLLQRAGQVSRAEQALQRALRLDPINPDVRNAVDDLKRGKPIQPAERPAEPMQTPPDSAPPVIQGMDDVDDLLLEPGEEERGRTPVDEAARYAMGVLADSIWAGEVPPAAQTPLLQALDSHQIGDADVALDRYLEALHTGLDHPALHFNLAVLYQATHRYEKVIETLSRITDAAEYAVAGNLLLGQAYLAQDDRPHAAEFLLRALRAADRQTNPAEVDEGGYERMLANLPDQSAEHLAELSRALRVYLDAPDWQRKLQRALSDYAGRGKVSYVPDLIELMIEGGRPELAAIMERVSAYLQRNMIYLATEEAHYAIACAPDYLPAHRRLADILIKEGRTQDAATKINLIANTYLIRGNADKAADLFAEVIDLWPADTGARRRVIDMLRDQGRVAEALHQYAEMADLYYRLMADPEKAIEVYNESLEYIRQTKADPKLAIPLLKGLATIESQRLNWRKALNYYDRIVELEPGNESAALARVDLHFQLGESGDAVRALDEYIRQCIGSGQLGRVTLILEDQVRHHPQEISLRQRLAEVYRQQGRAQEAITQMDALGELQLDAGLLDDALATIRKIIELNPPDVEGYRRLLAQLESGGR